MLICWFSVLIPKEIWRQAEVHKARSEARRLSKDVEEIEHLASNAVKRIGTLQDNLAIDTRVATQTENELLGDVEEADGHHHKSQAQARGNKGDHFPVVLAFHVAYDPRNEEVTDDEPRAHDHKEIHRGSGKNHR